MKIPMPFAAGLIVAILVSGFAHGQEPRSTASLDDGRLEVAPLDVDPSKIRFNPPPAPKPAPAVALRRAAHLRKADHTITLGVGEPSTLPDIPAPLVRVPAPVRDFDMSDIKSSFLLGISATVYLDGAQTRSFLRWHDPRTREVLEAWCAWDWSLLGPLVRLESADTVYDLWVTPVVINLSKFPELARVHGIPEFPDLEANEFAITMGDPKSATGEAFMAASLRYLNANLAKLIEIRAAHQRVRLEKAEWEAANPWQPRDYTMVLRPHRGSRYLETSTTEADR